MQLDVQIQRRQVTWKIGRRPPPFTRA